MSIGLDRRATRGRQPGLSRGHIGLALVQVTAQNTADHLRVALDTNREIAMAIGIIMNSRKLDENRAFELLRSLSQHEHTKMRELAASIVFTGDLPQLAYVRDAPRTVAS